MVVFTARTDMVTEHWRRLKQEERLCRGKESQADRPSPDPQCYLLEQGRNPADMLLADEGEGWECEGYHGEKRHLVAQLKHTF